MFITLEGIDGCGKTTQARLLHKELSSHLSPRLVVLVRDPGGTTIGDRIRAILLDPAHMKMAVAAEVLLYFASRAQLVEEIIRPAIGNGDLVISDRYFDATLAYQGYGRGVEVGMLEELQRFSTRGLMPDLTFLLDIDPDIGRARIAGGRPHDGQSGGDRMERQGADFARQVRDGYLVAAKAHPDRIRVLDAARPPEAILRDMRMELDSRGL